MAESLAKNPSSTHIVHWIETADREPTLVGTTPPIIWASYLSFIQTAPEEPAVLERLISTVRSNSGTNNGERLVIDNTLPVVAVSVNGDEQDIGIIDEARYVLQESRTDWKTSVWGGAIAVVFFAFVAVIVYVIVSFTAWLAQR